MKLNINRIYNPWCIIIISCFILVNIKCAHSAILVLNHDGSYGSKPTISSANNDSDTVGKVIIITSPQSLDKNIVLNQDREWRIEKNGYINLNGFTFTGLKTATPDMFGINSIPGKTDMTAAVQAAFDAVYSTGGELMIPPSVYRITSMVGISSALKESGRGFPTIRGVKSMAVTNNLPSGKIQDGSVILYDNKGGTAFSIQNDSKSNLYFGGLIRDLSIVKKHGDLSSDGSVGLSIKGAVDWRLYNVAIIGFDIGFKNYYSWSWDAYGLTCVRNNIGVFLDNNSNAVGLHGSQLHENRVNIKINSGLNILVAKTTIEGGASHGVVITNDGTLPAPGNITLLNLYSEQNPVDVIRIGKDENDNISVNSINNISIINPNFNLKSGIVPIQLAKTSNVIISQPAWGQTTALISTTAHTSNVTVNGMIGFQNLHLGDRYAVTRRIGHKNPYNLLAAGTLEFNDLTPFKLGGMQAIFDTTTFPGEKVVRITVPDGTINSHLQGLIMKADKRLVGRRLNFSGTAQADSGIKAQFRAFKPDGSGISGAAVNIPSSIDVVGFYVNCPDVDYLKISISLTNTSGSTKHVYIKSMVLTDHFEDTIQPSPLDVLSGFSGKVAATTSGTVVPLQGYTADMYEVVVTPYGNFTAYVTKSANQFTITSTANGTVGYLIIPKVGMQL